jgi:hypothetical protein
VIDKISYVKDQIGATRYVGQNDIGGQAFSDNAKSIELFATKVVAKFRDV